MRNFTLKSLMTLFIMVSFVTVVQAYDFEVDGIAYNVIADGECEVTSRDGGYTGDIVIPGRVVHEGVTYRVTEIGSSAFSECSSLASVSFPVGLTTIGDNAFYGCRFLTSVSLPNGLTTIGRSAFSGCSSLASVSLPPNGLTTIGDYAFSSCISLTSVSLPVGLTTIGDNAFYLCRSLTSVSLPNGLTTIGRYTFSGCSSLASVSLPESLTTIGRSAFSGCSSLTSVSFSEGLTTIGDYAFSDCSSLISVSLPAGLNKIGEEAFAGCLSLRNVVSYAVVPPVMVSANAFDTDTYNNATLTVPLESANVYAVVYGWKNFTNIQGMSGIDDVQSDVLSLTTDGMTVTVNGLADGVGVRVWDMSGRLVYDGTDSCITLPAHGVYVITAGGRTAKVSL